MKKLNAKIKNSKKKAKFMNFSCKKINNKHSIS